MVHLNFNQSFSFTVNVGNYKAQDIIDALGKAKFKVSHNVCATAPKTVDIIINCRNLRDASNAVKIIDSF